MRGDVVVRPLSDHPGRFAAGSRMRAGDADLVVAASRPHQGDLIVTFEGVADRDAAASLRGAELTIAASERRELDDGEYWPDQLEGIAVLDPGGDRIGTVAGVVIGDAQDRLVIAVPGGRQVEVPFVDELVGEVHPSGGFVVVDLPDGLLDGSADE